VRKLGEPPCAHGLSLRLLAVSLGALALAGRAPPLLPRDGDGHSPGRRAAGDDLRCDVVQLRARRPRRVPEQQEGLIDCQPEALGEDALRLLDDDARIQRRLQLLDTLDKGGDVV